MKFRLKSAASKGAALLFLILNLVPPLVRSESYEDLELTSRNLVLPEAEQFRLCAKLFQEKDKKLAAWKAYQTFLYNYPESPLAGDAQFMLAESVFQQTVSDFKSGNPPDEMAWRKTHKGGLKTMGKGIKKSLEGLKNLGATVSGEAAPPKDMEQIDVATFSEAIEQYLKVLNDRKKAGLHDTTLLRIAGCHYNNGDYPTALDVFMKIHKDYTHSY